MLKSVMLVSALAISAPVLAQQGVYVAQTGQKAEKQDAATQNTTTDTTADQPIKANLKTDTTAAVDPLAADTTTEVAATPPAAGDVSADAAAVAETAPAPAAPVATAQAQPEATTPAPAQQGAVTGAAQIAQVISAEFPTYDGNKDGSLEKAEFGKWMVALKTASDPSTKATDPATVQWVSGAFAQADADKSNNVSQAELTKFLTQGAD